MKNVRLIMGVALLALLTACCKDKPKAGLLDENAMVYINVSNGKSTRVENPDLPDNPAHLTPHQLVAQAENMEYVDPQGIPTTTWLGGIIKEGEYLTHHGRKAGEYQYKLLDEAKFVFWGSFIIGENYKTNEPELVDNFFKATNVRFVDKNDKIIGYLPQRVLKEAWGRIQKHFEAKEYDAVYKIFRETYQAFPCTPEEYAQLKAEGKN